MSRMCTAITAASEAPEPSAAKSHSETAIAMDPGMTSGRAPNRSKCRPTGRPQAWTWAIVLQRLPGQRKSCP
jgi:hypothetical protein